MLSEQRYKDPTEAQIEDMLKDLKLPNVNQMPLLFPDKNETRCESVFHGYDNSKKEYERKLISALSSIQAAKKGVETEFEKMIVELEFIGLSDGKLNSIIPMITKLSEIETQTKSVKFAKRVLGYNFLHTFYSFRTQDNELQDEQFYNHLMDCLLLEELFDKIIEQYDDFIEHPKRVIKSEIHTMIKNMENNHLDAAITLHINLRAPSPVSDLLKEGKEQKAKEQEAGEFRCDKITIDWNFFGEQQRETSLSTDSGSTVSSPSPPPPPSTYSESTEGHASPQLTTQALNKLDDKKETTHKLVSLKELIKEEKEKVNGLTFFHPNNARKKMVKRQAPSSPTASKEHSESPRNPNHGFCTIC